MEKRIKIKCCSCDEEYTLLRDLNLAENPRFITRCPFCDARCEVDLYSHLNQAEGIYKGGEPQENQLSRLDFDQPFISQKTDE